MHWIEGSEEAEDYLGRYAAISLIISCALPNNAQPTHPDWFNGTRCKYVATELVNYRPIALQVSGLHQLGNREHDHSLSSGRSSPLTSVPVFLSSLRHMECKPIAKHSCRRRNMSFVRSTDWPGEYPNASDVKSSRDSSQNGCHFEQLL